MTTWLVDKSALNRLHLSPQASEWTERIHRGLLRIATVTRLEVGYSARSGAELRNALRKPPLASMPIEYSTPMIEDRAVDVVAQDGGGLRDEFLELAETGRQLGRSQVGGQCCLVVPDLDARERQLVLDVARELVAQTTFFAP
jgi:hypothetical protein